MASCVSDSAGKVKAHQHIISDTLAGQQDTFPRPFDIADVGPAICMWIESQVTDSVLRVALLGHYTATDSLLWIHGKDSPERVKQLESLLTLANKHGLKAYIEPTSRAIKHVQRGFSADSVYAQYNLCCQIVNYELTLSKAYLRLAAALRYGAIDPCVVINYYPQLVRASVSRPKYPRYYDYDVERPDSAFYAAALAAVHHDASAFLQQHCLPTRPEYESLRKQFERTTDAKHRSTLMANLERLRWRTAADSLLEHKRILINLPTQMLEAIAADGQQLLTMKVCYGDLSHRTPLLASCIVRADLNPTWTVPPSILNHDIAHRYAGRSGYFARQRMRAYERATNKEVAPASLSSAQWLSGKYRLTQDGGPGNALGRIVFRFANNHSIYLHDTNSRSAFQSARRNVSHGCVRVEQPYELAKFLLTTRDSVYEANIAYTIGVSTNEQHKPQQELTRVRYDNVPLFITYYTAWPDSKDSIVYYPDIYEYDDLIVRALALW